MTTKKDDKCCFCKDIKKRINELEKENRELRKYKQLYNEAAVDNALLQGRVDYLKENAKKEMLDELVRPFMQTIWTTDSRDEYITEKCGLCDDERKRHFTSPLGRHMTEYCDCARKHKIYSVIEIECVKMEGTGEFGYDYYFKPRHKDFFNNRSSVDGLFSLDVYNGQEFEKLNAYRIYFTDKSKAEEYCKWLNGREEKAE